MSDYEDDFGTPSKSSVTSSSYSSASSSSSSSSRSEVKKDNEKVLHKSRRTEVQQIQDDYTTYRRFDDPDEVESYPASVSLSERSVSDPLKQLSASSPLQYSSSKGSTGSAPVRKSRHAHGSALESPLHRADAANNGPRQERNYSSVPTLPSLSKQRVQPQTSPSRSDRSPARSEKSRSGISTATLRTTLLDRIEDLKMEIKDIEIRTSKRQRELQRWKNLTSNTSMRRRRFVDRLLRENEILEKRLEKYDGQVVNVAFLIARTEEQLKAAENRLAEVTKIKRVLAARDKRAAHTIEVVHRCMPTAEELETREVNETIYSCASLEKKVAYARDSLQRTEDSLELMTRNCERLQRDVDRRSIAAVSSKAYEELRTTHDEQAKEIQKLRESISIYINAVNLERARMAANSGLSPRKGDAASAIPEHVRELQRRREGLEEQITDVKERIEQCTEKISTNQKYMNKVWKKRDPSADALSPKKAKKPVDPLEEALLKADQASRRIVRDLYKSDVEGIVKTVQKPDENKTVLDDAQANPSHPLTPGEKATKVLKTDARKPSSNSPPALAETQSHCKLGASGKPRSPSKVRLEAPIETQAESDTVKSRSPSKVRIEEPLEIQAESRSHSRESDTVKSSSSPKVREAEPLGTQAESSPLQGHVKSDLSGSGEHIAAAQQDENHSHEFEEESVGEIESIPAEDLKSESSAEEDLKSEGSSDSTPSWL